MSKYCENVYATKRRPTRTVWAGEVAIGSEHRIALQTMTTTDSTNVAATVDQVHISRLAHKKGSHLQLVRFTN